MIRSFLFYARLVIAWYLVALAVFLLASWIWSGFGSVVQLLGLVAIVLVVIRAHSHLVRVRMIAGKLSAATLASRQRRQIEVPFEAEEAFDLLDAAIRDLPGIDRIDSARDHLQIRASARYADPYDLSQLGRWNPMRWIVSQRNRILATVNRGGDGSSSFSLVCEPQSAPWSDWLQVDDGINLENIQAIAHAVTLAVATRRRGEQAAAAQTATEKELAIARLSLLQAQVEPHFLYNTLASAQVLVRSEPAGADAMLGHLIQYLRHSLPRTDRALSTLGDELERSRAYLEIMKIRMGPRLTLHIDVADELLVTPLPPMLLQTLVENAIKHGLEPRPGEGTVWIFARQLDGNVAVTVADDGKGFDPQASGAGIGLKNARERLKLTYAGQASLVIAANFPQGVAATISVPRHYREEASHG